jgi:hypothetical protein
MERRGPASFFFARTRSNRSIEDRPDRFRPPPCMPDGDPAVRSVDGIMVRNHRARLRSADAALACRRCPTRRTLPFSGRRYCARLTAAVGETSSDAVVTAELFTGGSEVMQAMDQTNPANSRAIAVAIICLGLPFAILCR